MSNTNNATADITINLPKLSKLTKVVETNESTISTYSRMRSKPVALSVIKVTVVHPAGKFNAAMESDIIGCIEGAAWNTLQAPVTVLGYETNVREFKSHFTFACDKIITNGMLVGEIRDYINAVYVEIETLGMVVDNITHDIVKYASL